MAAPVVVDAQVSTPGEACEPESGSISAPMVAALEGAWAAICELHPEVPAVVIVLGIGSFGAAGGPRLGHFAAICWNHRGQAGTTEPTEAGLEATQLRLPEVFGGGKGLFA